MKRVASIFLEVDKQLLDRDAILTKLRSHLHQAQRGMKAQTDRKRQKVSFEVGDLVLLKLRPYRHKSLARRKDEKLSPRFYGPFKILSKVGEVTYRLQLLTTAQIHPVFHVFQPKRTVGIFPSLPPLPPQLSTDLELLVEPEQVLAIRPSSNSTPLGVEVLMMISLSLFIKVDVSVFIQFPPFAPIISCLLSHVPLLLLWTLFRCLTLFRKPYLTLVGVML